MTTREKGVPEPNASAPPCSEMSESYWEPASITDLDETPKPPSAAPRRVRRPSLREVEKQAGRPVTSITIAPDGSRTYAFGQPEATNKTTPAEEPQSHAMFKVRAVPKKKVIL